MKKFLSLMLIFTLVLSMFTGMTVTASADDTGTGGASEETTITFQATVRKLSDKNSTETVTQYEIIGEAGSTISQDAINGIPDITKCGNYYIGGWDQVIPTVMPEEDMVINAYLIYMRHFKPNGGEFTNPEYSGKPEVTAKAVWSPQIVNKEYHYVDVPEVKRDGYEFLGWWNYPYNPDYRNPAIDPGQTRDNVSFKKSGTAMIARWAANTYTVTFHANNDDPNTIPVVQNFVYDSPQNLIGNSFTKKEIINGETGYYEFKGWATSTNGPVVYTDGQLVNLVTEPNGNVDLYAVWYAPDNTDLPAPSGARYYVEYYAEGPDGSYTLKKTDVLSGKIDDTVTADSDKYLDDTHHVNTTDSELVGTVSFDLNAANPMETLLTLKVYYDLNEYDVIFHSNNPNNEQTATQHFVYDKAEALKDNTFTRPGYIFRGWATSADGNVVYNDKAVVSNLTKTHEGNFDLYAVWTPEPVYIDGTIYYVEYYVEGPDGSYTQVDKKVMYGDFGTTVKADINKYLDAEHHVNTAASILEGKISVLGPMLTLKVYYDLNEVEIEPDIDTETDTDTDTADQARIDALADFQLVARSKRTKAPSGKDSVRITWYDKYGADLDAFGFDGFEIYRSEEKDKGYGDEPFFVSKTGVYYNTKISKGNKYYYKVRGYIIVDGEKYYTDWSLKAIRTVK